MRSLAVHLRRKGPPQMSSRPPASRERRPAPQTELPPLALAPAETLTGRLPGLVAAFSTALPRLDGVALETQLRALAARHWSRPESAVPTPLLLQQTHSPDILQLEEPPATSARLTGPAQRPVADGVAAGLPHARLLAVRTADCVPLLAVDEALGRYAALHAGWRGSAAGILTNLLQAWRTAGSGLASVHLELGPHIQSCCYEVGADCLERFAAADLADAVLLREGRSHLHLAAVLRTQALRAGVPAAHIHVSPHCTDCHRAPDGSAPYAGYRRARRDGGNPGERNVGLIGVLAPR